MKALLLTTLFSLVIFSFSSFDEENYLEIVLAIQSKYESDLELFKNNLNDFVTQFNTRSQSENESKLLDLRRSYKKIETFIQYFQEEAVLKTINGAPLPKPDPVTASMEVIEPQGIQALEEALCGDFDRAEAFRLAEKLQTNVHQTIPFEFGRKLQHRFVFEASRMAIIRIYTLSLTGFDTPVCSDGLDESIVILKTLAAYFETYHSHLSGSQKTTANSIVNQLNNCANEIQQYNFDELPRLDIYLTRLKPIYELIYELHKNMGVEYVGDVDPMMMPYNYHAAHIYDPEFLNPGYFTSLRSEDIENEKKVALGKKLFFDPVLSRDLQFSCASCHQPDKAFTDGQAKSIVRDGKTTLRNAPTLINSAYAEKYFWDLREYSLERQVKHVIFDHKEFDMDFLELTDRLKLSDDYLALFNEAYGKEDKYKISTWSISNALACYVTSLTAFNSTFDQYVNGKLAEIDNDIIQGHDLFMGKASCGICHFPPTFSGLLPPSFHDSESEVLGVPIRHDTINPEIDTDPGRIMNSTKRDRADFYSHAFKTMTVRNASLTAPYFHHGAYDSLEDVIDFYNRGGGSGMGMTVPNQTLPDTPLDLTELEKNQIIAFIQALTDTSGLTSIPVELPAFPDHPEFNDRTVLQY